MLLKTNNYGNFMKNLAKKTDYKSNKKMWLLWLNLKVKDIKVRVKSLRRISLCWKWNAWKLPKMINFLYNKLRKKIFDKYSFLY